MYSCGVTLEVTNERNRTRLSSFPYNSTEEVEDLVAANCLPGMLANQERYLIGHFDRNTYAVDSISAHSPNDIRHFAYFSYRGLHARLNINQALWNRA